MVQCLLSGKTFDFRFSLFTGYQCTSFSLFKVNLTKFQKIIFLSKFSNLVILHFNIFSSFLYLYFIYSYVSYFIFVRLFSKTDHSNSFSFKCSLTLSKVIMYTVLLESGQGLVTTLINKRQWKRCSLFSVAEALDIVEQSQALLTMPSPYSQSTVSVNITDSFYIPRFGDHLFFSVIITRKVLTFA